MWSALQPRMTPEAFAKATGPLIGMPVSEIKLRWDHGLSLDLGRMSGIDDVMSWGEALVGIAPRWRIVRAQELIIHSDSLAEKINTSLYRVSGLSVERLSFGDSLRELHITLSDSVQIDFLGEDPTQRGTDKKWLIVPPAGGMIYMKSGKVRFDSSHRTTSSILGLPPGVRG